MLVNNYKIIILGKNIYREYSLGDTDSDLIQIGTTKNCQVRFKKSNFFGDFQFSLSKTSSGWQLNSGDGVYFTIDDVMKVFTKDLSHGDKISARYENNNSEMFKINFFIDFDSGEKNYERIINIAGKQSIKIGGKEDCDIYIQDRLLEKDTILLTYNNREYSITDNNTKYGAYVNGKRIKGACKLNNQDFFAIVGYSFYLKDNKLYTSKIADITVKNMEYRDISEQNNSFVYPKFNRSTRMKHVIPGEKIEILPPQQKEKKPRTNIILTIAPAIALLALTIVVRGSMGGGGSFVIYSAASMGIGLITSIVGLMIESKRYKKDEEERKRKYIEYIKDKESQIKDLRIYEKNILEEIYVSIDRDLQFAHEFDKRLFERDKNDEDFLDVRVGTGVIESNCKIDFKPQEFKDTEDELTSLPEEISNKYKYIDNSPIVSKFSQCNAVGVVGSRAQLYSILKNITVDLLSRHFYKDVKMFYMFSHEDCEKFSWLRWLKHTDNEELDIKNIMYDEESKNINLEYLYSELSNREAIKKAGKDEAFKERFVVFVFDKNGIEKHPISKYIESCNELGFVFIFFEEYEEQLPKGCTQVIKIKDKNSGVLLSSNNSENIIEFNFNPVEDVKINEFAVKLSSIDVDEVNLDSEMTKNISLFQLLEIMSVDDLDLSSRWNGSTVYQSMAAPLGVKLKNEKVYLDLSDKKHGPHGLVAGTTGSGKSEILQTYILSMATLYHPYEVGFVIIDFKGGGMANQFKNLPHLIGTITNIDGREINRSLLSIKAELIKRQEMFSACGVNNINDYIKLYKSQRVDIPMPHLIMIVDEFAELKSEHPDFMKEIISAARIGRTLGIHLILATQKPAGVVDNQIWSNSRFKLCLKVQTKEDSNEVIKTPLAAEIVEPGRAYLQVGNNEIFDLFQSAYSGGNVPIGNDMNEKIFNIYERNIWGKKTLVYTNRKKQDVKEAKNQLQAIVEYVNDFCATREIKKLPGICLPSLADVIKTDVLSYEINNDLDISIPIGMFDDPEQQRQDEVVIEPSKENIFIVGSAQSGKTVMLQTITYGLIKKYDPSQVNIYFIDCGSMVLKIFEDSAHVGGVVLSNEEEKCKNLFKLINTIVAERKNILSSKGVGNFSAYLEAGYKDLPMVIVVIDNMAAFKEYFPNQAEELNSLSREAQGVGISFVITSATSNALNYRTQANFGKKFVLNCIDSNEYSNAFGHCKQTPKENAGRGLLMLDKRILEYQVAVFGQSSKEAERSQELKQFIEKRNTNCSCNARTIPMVPEKLMLHQALKANGNAFRNKGVLPIGMDFATVDYSILNLNTCGSMSLLGDAESKGQFAINLLRMLKETIIFHNIEAIVIDDKAKTLKECSTFGFVKRYTNDISEGLSLVNDFCDDISRRRNDMEDLGKEDVPYLLLLLNNNEVFKRICNDKNDSKAFTELVKGASEAGAFVLLTTVENQPVGFNSSDVLKAIKDERKAILFTPLSESKLFDISSRNRLETSLDKSTGYRLEGGNYTKIKIFE